MGTNLDIAMPFISASDPVTGGEGAIDPLGFAQVAGRLADWVLPGWRREWRGLDS